MVYLVSQLLTQSAQRIPEQIAVIDGPRQQSYQALDGLSNQFSHLLLEVGVQRGDRVGLYLEKSLEAVAALFGIMKTSAAYVPLDPAAGCADCLHCRKLRDGGCGQHKCEDDRLAGASSWGSFSSRRHPDR